MSDTYISENIQYIGVNDREIDLFESQYVVPEGVSYNSYLIMDEKVAVMDTVDARKLEPWMEQLETALHGRTPDYLVVSHMEPDHGAGVAAMVEKYPNLQVVGNAKTFTMIGQFFDLDLSGRKVEVKEGDTLSLGAHTLSFYMAPMVHWPEVMVTYESTEKILFSADGFGKFGALDAEEDWACEARRYYFNIVGKYGASVQALLKKAATLDIQMICPLHGPILKENLGYYIDKYNTWSSYQPEDRGVLIAYASIHGNTAGAANEIADMLQDLGEEKISVIDLCRDDMAEAVEDAFRYDRLIVAASSYDGGLFPPMELFLLKLKAKAYQNRKAAIIENGSWAPCAAKKMKEYLDGMKDVQVQEQIVTIKSTLNDETRSQLQQLAETMKNA